MYHMTALVKLDKAKIEIRSALARAANCMTAGINADLTRDALASAEATIDDLIAICEQEHRGKA